MCWVGLSVDAVQGYHGIEDEIYISLPVVVGESGITSVFNQKLADDERGKIQNSAKTLREVLDSVKIWVISSHLISAHRFTEHFWSVCP